MYIEPYVSNSYMYSYNLLSLIAKQRLPKKSMPVKYNIVGVSAYSIGRL